MKINLDISKNIVEQFYNYIGGEELENGFVIHPNVGTNQAVSTMVELPGGVEFYHFGLTQFKVPIELHTINKSESDWFLVHINLSHVAQEKLINGKQIIFQKHLPIGILFCGPDLEMHTAIPQSTDVEVASIRFNRSFLRNYFDKNSSLSINKSISYEDIDEPLARILYNIIGNKTNKLKAHGLVLDFLDKLFSKLDKHDNPQEIEKLHPKDFESIMKVSVHLRDPTKSNIPSVQELAKMANMGITKFKDAFKQVFGKPPYTYRHRIRMEYAHQQLINDKMSPTEVSYELGYTHPSNFTAAYKKHFGKLPSNA
jgi:AraC-like DNA-binding protein